MRYIFNLMFSILLLISAQSFSQKKKNVKVLFVLTSHDQLGSTGEKTGIWLEEFATPYYALKDKGVTVSLASPNGGQVPIDPKSQKDEFITESTKRLEDDKQGLLLLANTLRLSQIKSQDYDAVFYPGGHGPMWDLSEDKISAKLIESFYVSGKPLAFVCHAPAALKNALNGKGDPLIKGKKVTAFTDTEEEAVKLTSVVPFSLEKMLKDKGAYYEKGEDWKPFVVKDKTLITGQNPASSNLVAVELLKMLKVD